MTAAGAEAATAAFAARSGTRPRDAALSFAWSTAATIEPWPEGREFFPRILADIEEAERMLDTRRHNIFKLKIGLRSVDDDVAHVAAIKRALGDRASVRVDVN